jgi:uracil phosphoribosyltransferase
MTLDVHVVDHPLVAQKLTRLRDAMTPSPQFRRLVDELTTLLGYEATRELPTVAISVVTPVAAAAGTGPAGPPPLVVPVLRAGVGMLDAMIRLIPEAEVGFVGLARDETTLAPVVYAERLPADLTGRQVYVVDPMLATGGTLSRVLSLVAVRRPASVCAVCLLAAPEGVARVRRDIAELAVPVRVVLAAVDDKLDDRGYIVPGLGDAGDRLFGIV